MQPVHTMIEKEKELEQEKQKKKQRKESASQRPVLANKQLSKAAETASTTHIADQDDEAIIPRVYCMVLFCFGVYCMVLFVLAFIAWFCFICSGFVLSTCMVLSSQFGSEFVLPLCCLIFELFNCTELLFTCIFDHQGVFQSSILSALPIKFTVLDADACA